MFIHEHLELPAEGASEELGEDYVADYHRDALPDNDGHSTSYVFLEHQDVPLLIVNCEEGED